MEDNAQGKKIFLIGHRHDDLNFIKLLASSEILKNNQFALAIETSN